MVAATGFLALHEPAAAAGEATGAGARAEQPTLTRIAQAQGNERQPGGVELRPGGDANMKPMGGAPEAAPAPAAAAVPTSESAPPPSPPPSTKTEDKGPPPTPKTRSLKARSASPTESTPLGGTSGGDERRPGGVEHTPTRE